MGFHPYFLVPAAERRRRGSHHGHPGVGQREEAGVALKTIALDGVRSTCTRGPRPQRGEPGSRVVVDREEFGHWVIWTLPGKDFVCPALDRAPIAQHRRTPALGGVTPDALPPPSPSSPPEPRHASDCGPGPEPPKRYLPFRATRRVPIMTRVTRSVPVAGPDPRRSRAAALSAAACSSDDDPPASPERTPARTRAPALLRRAHRAPIATSSRRTSAHRALAFERISGISPRRQLRLRRRLP